MPEFAPVLIVSALNGTNGFRLDGDAANDRMGYSVAGAGDVNGDGLADLLIGAPDADVLGANFGAAYVVFSAAANPISQKIGGRVAAGSAYMLIAESPGDDLGISVHSAGDVNGDGFDDLIVGARFADPDAAGGNRGASYLVFGGAANLEALDNATLNDNLIALSSLTAATGYRFDGGANGDYSGWSVSGAGDVNGDGIADLLIGAPRADPNSGAGNGNEGAAYIVFGGLSNLNGLDSEDGVLDGRIDLARISAGQGLRLDGETTSPDNTTGNSVAFVGDVNGDGFGDVLVGAPGVNVYGGNTEGAAYLVLGRPGAQFNADSFDLSDLNSIVATRFNGIAGVASTGKAVDGLGDINGDGFADMVIGAPTNIGGPGNAYVVFGRSSFASVADLSALDGSNGFRLAGLRQFEATGKSVSSAGDVNGDGFADILVSVDGFSRAGVIGVGALCVIFGKATGFSASIDIGSLNGDNGFLIEGVSVGDELGFGVKGAAGDVNGDGFDDILVSANRADNNALNDSGSTYIIYGHRAETAVTRIGTALDNTMNGGKDDDTISGLSGNDKLIGWEGDDTINGGAGNDVINDGIGNDIINAGSGRDSILVTSGEDRIDGGSDKDLLDCRTLTGAININLSNGTFVHPNGEDLITLVSIEDVRGTSFNDTIIGGLAANYLIGFAGNDSLDGGASADLIEGGLGIDTMTGGASSDRFIFRLVTESGVTAPTRDIVTDFTVNPAAGTAFVDRIDLNVIDAQAGLGGNQAFTFITTTFTAEGQVRALQSGANTILEINTTGATVADMTIQLSNFTATNLTAADFIL